MREISDSKDMEEQIVTKRTVETPTPTVQEVSIPTEVKMPLAAPQPITFTSEPIALTLVEPRHTQLAGEESDPDGEGEADPDYDVQSTITVNTAISSAASATNAMDSITISDSDSAIIKVPSPDQKESSALALTNTANSSKEVRETDN
jgi:hypothetical protein